MGSAKSVRGRKPNESPSSGSSAAEVIASDEDLLTELLLRLSIKSLLKFESVCKKWLSLITDPHFIRRKSLNSDTICALYARDGCYYELVPLDGSQKRATIKSLEFVDSHHRNKILQSCKGLLLCGNISEKKYFVYNPTTKQFKTLPPPRVFRRAVLGINLAFDPSRSGFYKVVCIQGACHASQIKILIYSSETGCWRVIERPFTASLLNFHHGVYWNGAIHWVSETYASLYFDLDEELLQKMPVPPPLHGSGSRWFTYFGESSGHLHLVGCSMESRTPFNLYEMERDRSSWFVKAQVDPNVFNLPCGCICSIKILCVVRVNEDTILVSSLCNGKIIKYNLTKQTPQEICQIDSSGKPLSGWPQAFQYIESLSPV